MRQTLRDVRRIAFPVAGVAGAAAALVFLGVLAAPDTSSSGPVVQRAVQAPGTTAAPTAAGPGAGAVPRTAVPAAGAPAAGTAPETAVPPADVPAGGTAPQAGTAGQGGTAGQAGTAGQGGTAGQAGRARQAALDEPAVPAEPPANRPTGEDTRPTGGGAAARADTLASTRVATRGRGRLMASTLTGDVVAPRKGDPRGVGVAAVRVEPGKICLEGTVTGTDAITSMRLHRGARGTAGPAVASFPLAGPERAAGCVRVPGALTARILDNPENWHLLAGTARFPGAALRGQLMW